MIKLKFKIDFFKSSDKFVFYKFFSNIFFIAIKISKTLSAKYYQENKERLQKRACERYQSFSKKEKEKKQQYGCECYKISSEDEKQKLVENR